MLRAGATFGLFFGGETAVCWERQWRQSPARSANDTDPAQEPDSLGPYTPQLSEATRTSQALQVLGEAFRGLHVPHLRQAIG